MAISSDVAWRRVQDETNPPERDGLEDKKIARPPGGEGAALQLAIVNREEPHMPRSRMLAPLLLLAAVHRMVLEGQLPAAARFYPSAGGQVDVDALWPHLLAAARPGVATIVYHSVVLPYLTEEKREHLRRLIEDAGTRASTEAPLARLSMEPGADQADVHLTMWPGGERRLIATSAWHGQDVKVL
jgi:hypothetical protein